MSSDVLRRAAALMRERAEAAIHDSEGIRTWRRDTDPASVYAGTWAIATDLSLADAQHIASWHPAVALAVADWLDDVTERARGTSQIRLERDAEEREWYMPALAVARTYLGETEPTT